MPTVPPLPITEEERAELQRRIRAYTTPQRAAKRARIVLLAADGLPNRDPASHWSHSQLARELADVGISASQIGRILADLDIKPDRVRSWITRPDDPPSGSAPPTSVGCI